jgi:hypothetical protein
MLLQLIEISKDKITEGDWKSLCEETKQMDEKYVYMEIECVVVYTRD